MSSTGNSMAGKVAFITGGGTGIGAAVAAQFVAAGGRVVLMGRRLAQLEAVAAKLGGLAVAGDAASTGDVRRALAQAREKFGRVDVLVANAGGHGVGDALSYSPCCQSLSGRRSRASKPRSLATRRSRPSRSGIGNRIST